MLAGTTRGRSRNLVLVAMIFAVSMTFIDQTIISIAVPQIQRELGLSSTGVQWAVNAYLLTLAAFFAFGGKLADTVGHRRTVTLGVIIFAGASALCGLTPTGGIAEAWIVAFRALQGVGGAIMFPAALAIVVQSFELHERGRALALFFGIAGGLTAVGPIAGGYLTEWTWRAIFWVNIQWPSSLLCSSGSRSLRRYTSPHPWTTRDWPSSRVGSPSASSASSSPRSGVGATPPFGLYRRRGRPARGLLPGGAPEELTAHQCADLPHTPLPGREPRAWDLVTRLRPGLLLLLRVRPDLSRRAGPQSKPRPLVLLHRVLRRRPARRPHARSGRGQASRGRRMRAGSGGLLAMGRQDARPQTGYAVVYIILAGAGMGLMLGQASTDAVNRASRFAYGEATGITQTVRNYAAGLGLAILGTVLVTELRSKITSSLVALGVPHPVAAREASHISQSQGGGSSVALIPHFARLDFAAASRTVFLSMAAVLAAAAAVAFVGLQRGRQQETNEVPATEDGQYHQALDAAERPLL